MKSAMAWLIWVWDATLVVGVFVALSIAIPAHMEEFERKPVAALDDGSLGPMTDEELAAMDHAVWP